jgi:hypothetical protein
LTCPAEYFSCIGSSTNPSATGVATSSKANPTCADAIISYTDLLLIDQACNKRIQRTWLATDPNNATLQSSCIQFINLRDNEGPFFANCPSDQNLTARNSDCKAIATWTEPIANDICPGAINIQASHTSGSLFDKGTTTVTYTATDACGNVSTCTFNINVSGIA